MRITVFITFLTLCLSFSALPAGAAPWWEPVVDGVDYRLYELAGPVRAHVARMDRNNPNLILDSSLAGGTLVQGLETVREMAERYDGAINAWGGSWGQRNKVVIAINGSFHDQTTGVPQSGQIQSGWYIKRFDDDGGGSGFAWGMDRRAFLGACVRHPADRQIIHAFRSRQTLIIDDINAARGVDELILYTPQYAGATLTDDQGIEVVVELSQPALILPSPGTLTGFVMRVNDGEGSTPIPFDSIVLSAEGRARERILQAVRVGDEIGISMEIEHSQSDCLTPSEASWAGTYASISGSFDFLRERAFKTFYHDRGATARHPRTAICYNEAYLYFVVVDGRDADWSIGMTIDELAAFCRGTLGAIWGINQDGGGSSTMWINGEVVNQTWKGVERAVANGMMIIAVQPMETSESFTAWQRVLALEPTAVRLGPGENYAILREVPIETTGLILPNRNGLEGVLAKGEYWWKVALGGAIGWAPESSLTDQIRGPSLQRLEDLARAP